MHPGSGREPDRQTQKREQWHDKEKLAHPVNIGRRSIRAMVPDFKKQMRSCFPRSMAW
jgi:hypothetical protein